MKKLLLLCSVLSLSVLWPGDAIAQLKIGGKKLNTAKLLDAGKDVAKAVTLSDSDIAQLSREAVAWMDANNPVADETTEYGARLKRLTEGITEVGYRSTSRFTRWPTSMPSLAATVRSASSAP
jgi:putative metalloprotease